MISGCFWSDFLSWAVVDENWLRPHMAAAVTANASILPMGVPGGRCESGGHTAGQIMRRRNPKGKGLFRKCDSFSRRLAGGRKAPPASRRLNETRHGHRVETRNPIRVRTEPSMRATWVS